MGLGILGVVGFFSLSLVSVDVLSLGRPLVPARLVVNVPGDQAPVGREASSVGNCSSP